jgi:hypothetical protein
MTLRSEARSSSLSSAMALRRSPSVLGRVEGSAGCAVDDEVVEAHVEGFGDAGEGVWI